MLALQLHAFLLIVLAGTAAGLLFDLLRTWRWWLQPKAAWAAAADLLYGLLVAGVMGAALFWGNWGQLRGYVLIGAGTGAGLYFWLASPVVRAMLILILTAALWLLRPFLVVGRSLHGFVSRMLTRLRPEPPKG